MSATRKSDSTAHEAVLYMALELSEKTWKLGFTTGLGQEPRQRDIPGRAVQAMEAEIPPPRSASACRRKRPW